MKCLAVDIGRVVVMSDMFSSDRDFVHNVMMYDLNGSLTEYDTVVIILQTLTDHSSVVQSSAAIVQNIVARYVPVYVYHGHAAQTVHDQAGNRCVCIPVRPCFPAASFAAARAAAMLAVGGCMPVSVDRRPEGELAMLSMVVVSKERSIATLDISSDSSSRLLYK